MFVSFNDFIEGKDILKCIALGENINTLRQSDAHMRQ